MFVSIGISLDCRKHLDKVTAVDVMDSMPSVWSIRIRPARDLANEFDGLVNVYLDPDLSDEAECPGLTEIRTEKPVRV